MNKLISANLFRLRKNKLFWIFLIISIGLGIYSPLNVYLDMTKHGYVATMDAISFRSLLPVYLLIAILCSLYIGTEYSDGTVRNKVGVGHKRNTIYFANFFICVCAGIIIIIAHFIGQFCIGVPLLNGFAMETKNVILYLIAIVMLTVAFVSIFTFVSMVVPQRTISITLCISIVLLFLYVGIRLALMLYEPKMELVEVLTKSGEYITKDMPNPRFLDGMKREIVQFVYDFLPGGQMRQIQLTKALNLSRLPLYSMIVSGLVTGLGLCLFKKKNLK